MERQAINCETPEKAYQVLSIASKLGYRWNFGNLFIGFPFYSFGANTCYCLEEGTHESVEYYKKEGYNIIKADDFINTHKNICVDIYKISVIGDVIYNEI